MIPKLSHNDIMLVEHYEQLSEEQRAEYRANCPWYETADNPEGVEAEFDRIDRGLKAKCLS